MHKCADRQWKISNSVPNNLVATNVLHKKNVNITMLLQSAKVNIFVYLYTTIQNVTALPVITSTK